MLKRSFGAGPNCNFFHGFYGLFKRNAYVAVEKLTFACPSTSNKGIDEQTIISITVAWSCSP
jgi:hypothetical protein